MTGVAVSLTGPIGDASCRCEPAHHGTASGTAASGYLAGGHRTEHPHTNAANWGVTAVKWGERLDRWPSPGMSCILVCTRGVGLNTCTARQSSTDVHISPTNTHQHLPKYPTMRLSVLAKDNATTQSGEVQGCQGHVRSQRGCTTCHPCTNRRQSVRRGGEAGDRTESGLEGVATRATRTTKQGTGGGGEEGGAGVG